MSQVNDLKTSLTSLCSTFLGASYGELKFKHNIESNSFTGSDNKYGVIAGDITGTSGATCFVTIEQTFEVVLTNSYTSVNVNDSAKDNARIALQDKSLDLYVDIVNKKADRSDIVMNIKDLSSNIEELEEDKVIINRLSFTITYRKAL